MAASSAAAAVPALNIEDDKKRDLSALPPVRIAIRSRHGVEFRSGPLAALTPSTHTGASMRVGAEGGPDGQVLFAQDGSVVAMLTPKQIEIAQGGTLKATTTISRARVEHMWFSPRASYLATWERKTPENKAAENLFVWRVRDGAEVMRLHWSDLDTQAQRPVQWTWDEEFVVTQTANEVKFFPADAPVLAAPSQRLHVQNVAQFALAPAVKPYQVAVFVPCKGTDPARVSVFTHPQFGAAAAASSAAAGSAAAAPVATASKSFYKAEEVSLKWSPLGLHLLIETRTATDKTGKSYYGESGLHLLAADGSFTGTVPFGGNPGPIQDVAWSPQGKEFLVIQGFQPAKSTLFVASTCTPIREYGAGSRNTIRWSPHGRFLMLGGFGNLAGELEFWDSFKFKLLGKAIDRDGAKSFEWTPDGRAFITASLRPWRRVDNGYKVWSYAGDLLYQEKYDELYQVLPQPALQGVYPNLPVSPRRKAMAAAGVQPAAAPAKPSAYIPPHLRAQGATAPSSIMKRDPDVMSGPRKLNQAERAAITGQPLPAAPEKAKPAAAAGGDDDESAEGSLSKNQLKRAKQKAREQKAREDAEAAAAAAEAAAAADAARKNDLSDPSVVARKLKAAQKKLRAIADLKEKGTAKLNEDQRAKIAQEKEILDEIDELTKLAAKLPPPSAAAE